MTISKPDLTRIWASEAPVGNIVDPSVTTLNKFNDGWLAEIPPFEHFNFIQKHVTQGLAHINEQGIPIWDNETLYPVGAMVKASDSSIYKALVEQSGEDPIVPSSNWIKVAASEALGTGPNNVIFANSAGRVGIGEDTPTAKLHVDVDDDISVAARFKARWQGETGASYNNNDVIYMETYNDILSDSENKSWAISSSNTFNNIPAGVTDSGWRVGVYGWATSVNIPGYTHAGTLEFQFGGWFRAGYQGSGANESPAGSRVNNAVGLRGEVTSDSTATTIVNAIAGEFNAYSYAPNTVENSYAIRADARAGTVQNWAYWGEEGNFFQRRQAFFSSDVTEVDAPGVSVRNTGNNIEFGYPSTGGLGAVLGCTVAQGYPSVVFAGEVGTTGNNYTTRGKVGHVIYDDLEGGLIFAVLASAFGVNQAAAEAFKVTEVAGVEFANNPILPSQAPETSTSVGKTGAIAWDTDYFYVCVATNNWKRIALNAW